MIEPYKSKLHFVVALLVNILVFALSLSIAITIIFYGYRIILNGVPMCIVLAKAGMLHTAPYNVCGCATVELVLLPISFLGIWFAAPRMFKQLSFLRQLR